MGHSIGRWEGDTLVIDTIGFNDSNMLTEGLPFTHQMLIVQRLSMVGGRLVDEATFEDPGTFTAPLKVTNRFEPGTPFQEYICAENNSEGGIPTATGKPSAAALPVAGAARP